MTKIAISPNVNGTGTFTLAAPNSNTDRTLTLPDAGGSVVLNEGSGTFKIDSAGNVGIGTSSPTSRLTLSTGDKIFVPTGEALNFGHTDGTTNTESARIDTGGRMLVGTTTATQFGTTQATLVAQHFPGVQAAFKCVSTITGGSGQVRFVNPNGEIGSIFTSGSSTAYNTSSDYRLKEDVQPMSGASDRVLALNPVNFAWKVDGSRVDGFLAHEAQAIVPESVTGEKDGEEMQAIDQSKLVPLLTAALQEALADIATLKAEVAALKGASA